MHLYVLLGESFSCSLFDSMNLPLARPRGYPKAKASLTSGNPVDSYRELSSQYLYKCNYINVIISHC